MSLLNLRISSVVYDDVLNTLTLTMLGDSPPPPANVDTELWYPAPSSFTVVLPIKRGTVTPATAVYTDKKTAQRYKTTSNGTAWSPPVAVDEQGKTRG